MTQRAWITDYLMRAAREDLQAHKVHRYIVDLERKLAKAEAKLNKPSRVRTTKGRRRKGCRAEVELSKLLGGRRVPLSGAVYGYPGDVIDQNGRRWECKARTTGLRTLLGWLADNYGLALKVPNAPWLVVLRMDDYLALRDMIPGNNDRPDTGA